MVVNLQKNTGMIHQTENSVWRDCNTLKIDIRTLEQFEKNNSWHILHALKQNEKNQLYIESDLMQEITKYY